MPEVPQSPADPLPQPPIDAEDRASRDQAIEIGERCPACDSHSVRSLFRATDRLYRTTDRQFHIVECTECRLVRLFPRPGAREVREYYPDTYWYAPAAGQADTLAERYRRFVIRDHVKFVRRALNDSGEKGTVLDVGCGGGLFLESFGLKKHMKMGLDFSLDAATTAWRHHGVPVVCGSLSQAPLPPSSCSVITMFHVLEHLYNPLDYLERAHELLQPNGRLIVQVPNAACWQFLLFGEAWTGVDAPRHMLLYRASDLEVLLDHCGFQVVRRKFFSLRDNPAGFASSIAPDLDPMARRIRHIVETPRKRFAKDLLYFGLVLTALPFTMVEALCRAGSTVMIEARKKP